MDMDSRLVRGGSVQRSATRNGGAALTADGGAPYPGGVGRWLTHSSAALAAVVLLAGGCASDPPAGRAVAPSRPPRLPAGTAGVILQRGLDAAGGWERWQRARDVSFISMITVTDQSRDVATDSIGWFTAPSHGAALARMDASGLPTEIRFGIDAAGRSIGAMVAEQFIEHVRFDNGYPPERFRAPAESAAQTAAAGAPRRGAS